MPSRERRTIPSGTPLVLPLVSFEVLVDGLFDVAVFGLAVSSSVNFWVVALCVVPFCVVVLCVVARGAVIFNTGSGCCSPTH